MMSYNSTLNSLGAAALSAGILFAGPANAAVLEPVSPFAITLGEAVSVEVAVAELGTEIVSAYDLDLAFDDAALEFVSVDFGELLGGPADSLQDSGVLGGSIDFAEVSFLSDDELDALQDERVLLATFNFTALVDATTDVSFEFPLGNDVKGRNNVVLIDGPPPPTGVDEPALSLLVSGFLLGLVGLRRRASFRAKLQH